MVWHWLGLTFGLASDIPYLDRQDSLLTCPLPCLPCLPRAAGTWLWLKLCVDATVLIWWRTGHRYILDSETKRRMLDEHLKGGWVHTPRSFYRTVPYAHVQRSCPALPWRQLG